VNIVAGLGILEQKNLKSCFDFEIEFQPHELSVQVNEEMVEIVVQDFEIEVTEDVGL